MIITVVYNCVDPFEAATQNYESTLVVEAAITNELKFQEINLGRTYRLETDGPTFEIDATVTVVDDAQNSYSFQEIDSGKYRSDIKFGVLPNRGYHLLVTTASGKQYASVPTKLTPSVDEFSIGATKVTNEDGIEGVLITANSFDPNGNSKYYRFDYEETYKIVAPYWSPLDAFGVSPLPTRTEPPLHEVYTLPRTEEEETCYKLMESSEILQTDTNRLIEDRVINFPVKFLPKDEFKITHRYSILVRQYVQTIEGSSFFNALNKLSGSESLFSQKQQGFIVGNIYAIDDPNEKTIGYFEVSSAKTQRLFFDFEDFFPGEEKPPHIVNCDVIKPDLDDKSDWGSALFSPLIQLLLYQDFKFVDFNEGEDFVNNPYFIVRKECGDCTSLGSNIKPEYWED